MYILKLLGCQSIIESAVCNAIKMWDPKELSVQIIYFSVTKLIYKSEFSSFCYTKCCCIDESFPISPFYYTG